MSQLTIQASVGSSPLSRGIHPPVSAAQPPCRIIPALAGNTIVWAVSHGHETDHPRSRGEYLSPTLPSGPDLGSSPLSRGIPSDAAEASPCHGIIPALAGNTRGAGSGTSRSPDHPRSRGEYCRAEPGGGTLHGSSPLSRGIRYREGDRCPGVRIIPALAGNTRPPSPATTGTRDHPRSRGEYLVGRRGDYRGPGSSPLSRGIPPR